MVIIGEDEDPQNRIAMMRVGASINAITRAVPGTKREIRHPILPTTVTERGILSTSY
jgi:hypothetical protein